MRLTEIMVILFLFVGFVSGFVGFYMALMDSYGASYTDLSSFNQTQRIYNKTYEMYSTFNQTKSEPPSPVDYILQVPAYLINGIYTAGMVAIEIPNLFSTIISDAVVMTGAPAWVGLIFWGIIAMIVMGSIIYFITGKVF